MKYVSAYLLATLGGDSSPSASKVESILKSVGLKVDPELANLVVSSLKGKDVNEVIAAGQSKLATVMSGASAAAVAAPAAGDAAPVAAAAAPAKEEKKEESDDEDMGFGLFD